MNKLLLEDILNDAEHIRKKEVNVSAEQSIRIAIEIRRLELEEKYLEAFKNANVIIDGYPSALEKIAMQLGNE